MHQLVRQLAVIGQQDQPSVSASRRSTWNRVVCCCAPDFDQGHRCTAGPDRRTSLDTMPNGLLSAGAPIPSSSITRAPSTRITELPPITWLPNLTMCPSTDLAAVEDHPPGDTSKQIPPATIPFCKRTLSVVHRQSPSRSNDGAGWLLRSFSFMNRGSESSELSGSLDHRRRRQQRCDIGQVPESSTARCSRNSLRSQRHRTGVRVGSGPVISPPAGQQGPHDGVDVDPRTAR